MHERADTAKENISARRRFPATNVPEVRRHGGAVLGRIRRPPRRVKTRSRQKPRKDEASDGWPAGGCAGNPARPAETRVGDPSRAQRGEQGLGRISGAGSAPAVRQVTRRDHAPTRWVGYLSSTLAPAPSSCALAFSASSLEAFSSTGFGADSTRSLASLSPRLVRLRTSLMTLIFSL